MSGRISSRDIEEIKSRANIADVVGEYVNLRPASVGSLKGLCPFHDEKSPSFNVRPAQGFYHCFGCGEGGDVFKFLQQLEKLSFSEAVERVAQKIGFQITYEAGAPSVDSGVKARVLEANSLAAEFYQTQLYTDEAIPARDFLKGRGFDKSAAQHFSVGYAPKGWSNLVEYLAGKGFSIAELVTAGLATKSDRGGYDKFRGRLIWPIRDTSNQVIGFGARKLYEDDQGPKYLNTSDTLVYHKSQVLYGLDLAKKEIAKTKSVVVVEGYTDVMACHLAGITTAVATCGTAFGDEHIRILNRLLGSNQDSPAEVVFTFDPDAAGQKAAMRAFNDSHKFHAQTYVAIGPDGLDPCDLRSQRGDAAVVAMISAKRPIFEFAIRQKIANFDLASLEGRIMAARSAAALLAQVSDPALRPAYTRQVAGWLNLEAGELAQMVDNSVRGQRADILQQMSSANPATPATKYNPNDPLLRFERTLLAVLLQSQTQRDASLLSELVPTLVSEEHRQILSAIATNSDSSSAADLANRVLVAANPELHSLIRELTILPLPASNEEELLRFAQGVIGKALVGLIDLQKRELLAQLRRLDANTESERIGQIQRELVALEQRRRAAQGQA